MNKITITIPESMHSLNGLGDVNYIFERNEIATMTIKANGSETVHTGKKAIEIYTNVNTGEKKEIEEIIAIAAFSCGIPFIRMFEKSRFEDVVFAKACVHYYLIRHKKQLQRIVCLVFGQDRSSIVHSLGTFEGKKKYLSKQQLMWKDRFLKGIELYKCR
jgi:hypothetical protein